MRKVLLGAVLAVAAAGAVLVVHSRQETREPPTLAELAASNYRVLSKEQSRALVRYAERVHRCLVAHGAAISEPVASSTRIAMRAPGATARELANRLGACESTVGPPPPKASLQARAGQVLVYLPKRCLLDPTEVDAAADVKPPSFAGLVSATTCIPGPVRDDRPVRYQLRWLAATDNVTPRRAIVYEIYRAALPRTERFVSATYRSAAGATSFATPPLRADVPSYFVVRARDRAGNRDRNRVERVGVNVCD